MSLVLALLLAACSPTEKAKPNSEPKVEGARISFPESLKALPGIVAEPVKSGAIRMLSVPGRLVWNEDRTVRMYSPFGGRVDRISVSLGATVVSGQPLASLSSSDFGMAQAEARKAAVDQALARQTLTRQKELFDAGIVARKDFEQVQAEAARNAAEHERTLARLHQYGVNSAEHIDQNFLLRSPIAGLVVERNVNPGMEVRLDSDKPLFVITEPSSLWAMLDVNEADLGKFKEGAVVTFKTAAYPDATFNGEVSRIADFVDPESRTVKVRVLVANKDRRLKGEMFITAQLALVRTDGLLVPARAVFLKGSTHYVFVREDARHYVRREVRTGQQFGDLIEVAEGVRADEHVVTEGNLYLQDIVQSAHNEKHAEAQAPKVSPPGVQGHGK